MKIETYKVLYLQDPNSPELLVVMKETPKGYSSEIEFHGEEAREVYSYLKGEHHEQ